MAEPLSASRFMALAEAYGAIARWPEGVRAEAYRMAAQQPDLAAVLAEAEALDARLDRWRVAPPSPALRAAIVAARSRSRWHRVRLWWSAIGLAAALAGATAGSFAAAVVPVDHPPGDETAFGNLSAQEG
jgi:hypothetical protein